MGFLVHFRLCIINKILPIKQHYKPFKMTNGIICLIINSLLFAMAYKLIYAEPVN